MPYLRAVSIVLGLVGHILALSPQFLPCQLQKPKNVSPLEGCPPGTIFVSHQDHWAHFKSVQEAVLSLCVDFKKAYFSKFKDPDLSDDLSVFLLNLSTHPRRPDTGNATILVGEGEYHDTINVTRSSPLILLVSAPNTTTRHQHASL